MSFTRSSIAGHSRAMPWVSAIFRTFFATLFADRVLRLDRPWLIVWNSGSSEYVSRYCFVSGNCEARSERRSPGGERADWVFLDRTQRCWLTGRLLHLPLQGEVGLSQGCIAERPWGVCVCGSSLLFHWGSASSIIHIDLEGNDPWHIQGLF